MTIPLLALLLACTTEPQPPVPMQAPPPEGQAPGAAQAPTPGTAPEGPAPGEPAPGFPPESPEGKAQARAEAAATAYATTLKGKLQEAIAAGGPPQGITVCVEAAPQIGAQIAAEQGVRIGRSSLRLRNPDNKGPDWVQAWLGTQGERPAEGLSVYTGIEGEVDARVARRAAPIAVEAVCLNCHGPVEGLSPEVKAAIATNYPADQATGYALGDLRGVLWVEAPVVP